MAKRHLFRPETTQEIIGSADAVNFSPPDPSLYPSEVGRRLVQSRWDWCQFQLKFRDVGACKILQKLPFIFSKNVQILT